METFTRQCRFCKKIRPLEEMVAHVACIYGRDTKCKECQKKYLFQYSKANLARRAAREREKRACDPEYKLICSVRATLRNALSRANETATKRLTGIPLPAFRNYFERLFRDGMTWENKSSWQIDHYVPLGYFDLSSPVDMLVANYWKNLRPTTAHENRLKHQSIPADAEAHIAMIRAELFGKAA